MPEAARSKGAFRHHLNQIGYFLDQPREVVRQELERHVGTRRYEVFQQVVSKAMEGGDEAQNRVYDFVEDWREANLLRCLSPNVALDTSHHLYEMALPSLAPGTRVFELACWTGGLASFVARHHPDCTVVGVDRARRILDLNRHHYELPNLSFTLWDYYHDDRPADLEPADLLLCGLGTNNNCPPETYTPRDPLTVRDTAGYLKERQEGCRYFTHWRQAARDGALLFAVLRVATFARLLAFLDAAQAAGWTVLFERLQLLFCPDSREHLPSMVFVARPSPPIAEEAALAHWTSAWMKDQHLDFRGVTALAMYQALGQKHVQSEREYRSGLGCAAREEQGTCGAFRYVFTQDARPEYRLAIMSAARTDGQRPSPPQMVQRQTPGVFIVTASP